jgi:elongation factor G
MMGSAYKNKGVQLLLDGVARYLPGPDRREERRVDLDRDEAKVSSRADPTKPLVMLAFKLEDGRYGQLTYLRVYQGTLRKGDFIVNTRTGKKVHKVGRLVRMHSDEMEDIEASARGRHRRDVRHRLQLGRHVHRRQLNVAMTSMFVPEPVISLAIKPKDKKAQTTCRRPCALHQGRPDLPRQRRPRDGRDHHPAWASCTSTCTSSA